MDIHDFIEKLQDRIEARGFVLHEDVESVDAQLHTWPQSAMLWIRRGDLIQLSEDADGRLTLEDALLSYQRAIELEPDNAQAYQSTGYFLDRVQDKPREAEPYFRKAIELGSETAHQGLKEVLDQLSKSD